MKKFVAIVVIVAATLVWYGFESVKATTVSEPNSDMTATNLTGADLTGANIAGVSLDGVILCNTTMPDGTINNSSCEN
jgi:uncharacterized protein YjbI with pentapeptide repeats